MTCRHIWNAIVCTRRDRKHRCEDAGCWRAADYQCDWKIGDGKTCDKYVCIMHADPVGDDKHLCPEHQKAYKEWLAKKEAAA